jgi:hypothetical protein
MLTFNSDRVALSLMPESANDNLHNDNHTRRPRAEDEMVVLQGRHFISPRHVLFLLTVQGYRWHLT